MKITINENFNKKLKDFQTILIKTCDKMVAQYMSIINLNMINIIKFTPEEQRVKPKLSLPSNQQQDINQQPNILQYVSPSTPVKTQPTYQLTESPLTSTEYSINERQPNSKRKQIGPPYFEEEVNTSDEINNQNIVMEYQNIFNPAQTRTSARLSTPATRDNKKEESIVF